MLFYFWLIMKKTLRFIRSCVQNNKKCSPQGRVICMQIKKKKEYIYIGSQHNNVIIEHYFLNSNKTIVQPHQEMAYSVTYRIGNWWFVDQNPASFVYHLCLISETLLLSQTPRSLNKNAREMLNPTAFSHVAKSISSNQKSAVQVQQYFCLVSVRFCWGLVPKSQTFRELQTSHKPQEMTEVFSKFVALYERSIEDFILEQQNKNILVRTRRDVRLCS